MKIKYIYIYVFFHFAGQVVMQLERETVSNGASPIPIETPRPIPFNNHRRPIPQHLLRACHKSFSSEPTLAEPEPVIYATSSSPGSGFTEPSYSMPSSRSNSPCTSASPTGDVMPEWAFEWGNFFHFNF